MKTACLLALAWLLLATGSATAQHPHAADPWTRALPGWDTGACERVPGAGWTGRLQPPVAAMTVAPGRTYSSGHQGIDIPGDRGTPVTAAAGGVVVWAGASTTSLGHFVALAHGGGWLTFYGHLETVTVGCGDWAAAGAPLGTLGDSGTATFVHVHLAVKHCAPDCVTYDPLALMATDTPVGGGFGRTETAPAADERRRVPGLLRGAPAGLW